MNTIPAAKGLRSDWTVDEILGLFDLPFTDLLFQAQTVHRAQWPANEVQLSTLLSVKTGGCSEDCGYCAQSARYDTGLERETIMDVEDVREKARIAKDAGATRFCMSAAWRNLKDRDVKTVTDLVADVKGLGLETCLTAGMITEDQAQALKESGLEYYNHNLDTSPEYYDKVITTRTYDDRLNTLAAVRKAGMKVCSGGILGLGETRADRASFLQVLATMDPHPESVPINKLVPIPGTPMENNEEIDDLEIVRAIAVARILMPKTYVRLSAGRTGMTEATQALCFLAGANSMFYGEKLLTVDNPERNEDRELFDRLGLKAEGAALDAALAAKAAS